MAELLFVDLMLKTFLLLRGIFLKEIEGASFQLLVYPLLGFLFFSIDCPDGSFLTFSFNGTNFFIIGTGCYGRINFFLKSNYVSLDKSYFGI